MSAEEKSAEENENRPFCLPNDNKKKKYPENVLVLVRYNSIFGTSSSNIHEDCNISERIITTRFSCIILRVHSKCIIYVM